MKEKRMWILGFVMVTFVPMALLILISTVAASPLASLNMAPALPNQITYQGQLLDKNTGNPVTDGKYDMTFAIYDDPVAGNTLWSQTLAGVQGVQVRGGQFTVSLGGALSPFPQDLFGGEPRWLGVTVGTDAEMTPRTKLSSVPYALTAESLRAGGITSDTLAMPLYRFHNQDPAGYALVAEGNVHVEGNLTWNAKQGRISVSPAAFQPWQDTYQFERTGRGMHSTSGEHYYAPVYLPDATTVSTVTFYYRDDAATTGQVTLQLKRGPVGNTATDIMAEIDSADSGYGNDYDDSIDYAQINNDGYIYWLYAKFDGTLDDNRRIMAVVIEYTYNRPH
jgi:hypothetical protein